VLASWGAPDREQEGLRERFLTLLRSTPEAVRADHPGPHLTASVVVVHADLERVLLCLHGRFRRWVQLGGHLEPVDDTLAGAGLREARRRRSPTNRWSSAGSARTPCRRRWRPPLRSWWHRLSRSPASTWLPRVKKGPFLYRKR
jgi:hypothetical protein